MKNLSHTNSQGKAKMVDVADKPNQTRKAKASGKIFLQPDTIQLIKDNNIKKGEVLSISEFAAIMAAKKTSELIPLCHPLLLTDVNVSAKLLDDCVEIEATVKCIGQTGVEMEALTATSIGLLTVYDMCKAVDKQMIISEIRLLEKTKS
ncbi:MAG: cyclic pyranopterin monophosphate synthase MoaC [Bacteroidetes bacterium HGW-Bacteroidetes-6]|jgi:cyclic pyranopterin phosphate synthase|nr:MAG: cyclic pyranopterin monophosphate synthase MoaC [Bacteroidetes bacterium HGW-Bacteroidetes-6]